MDGSHDAELPLFYHSFFSSPRAGRRAPRPGCCCALFSRHRPRQALVWTLPAAPPTLRTCLLGRGHQPDCPPQPPAGLRSGPSKRGRKRPSVPIHATAFPSIMGARTAVCWNGRSTTLCVSMSAVAATDAQPCVRTVSRCRMQSVVTKHQVPLASCGAVATYSCGQWSLRSPPPAGRAQHRPACAFVSMCPCSSTHQQCASPTTGLQQQGKRDNRIASVSWLSVRTGTVTPSRH